MLMGLPLGPAAGCRAWGNSAAAHEEAYVLKVTDKATDAENLEACLGTSVLLAASSAPR